MNCLRSSCHSAARSLQFPWQNIFIKSLENVRITAPWHTPVIDTFASESGGCLVDYCWLTKLLRQAPLTINGIKAPRLSRHNHPQLRSQAQAVAWYIFSSVFESVAIIPQRNSSQSRLLTTPTLAESRNEGIHAQVAQWTRAWNEG